LEEPQILRFAHHREAARLAADVVENDRITPDRLGMIRCEGMPDSDALMKRAAILLLDSDAPPRMLEQVRSVKDV
jgi:hypothetical protein